MDSEAPMNYKGIEYSLKSFEPGIWKYRFHRPCDQDRHDESKP
jgi:hypothetical protein